MQGVMPLFLSVLAGICLFASINHFLISLKFPIENREHVAFSVLCLVSFLTLLSIVFIFHASTLEEYKQAQFFPLMLAPFYYLAMIWFARVFTATNENVFFPILVATNTLFLIKSLVSPGNWFIEHMDGVQLPEQSWFGYHLEPVNPVYSSWAGIFFLAAYVNFFYIGYCAIASYKKNNQKGAVFLLITALSYICLFSLDGYILWTYQLSVYFSAFCFLPFLLLMSTHMTSEKHAQIVADNEEKYKRLIEAVEDNSIIYSYLPKGNIFYISSSIEKILGYTPANLIAGKWEKLAGSSGNVVSTFREHMESLLATGKKSRFEISVYDKNNNPVLFDVTLQVLFDANRKIAAIEGYARDITKLRNNENRLLEFNAELECRVDERTEELQNALSELRKEITEKNSLEQQLLQAQKMESIGQLAGGVAHDFNNIMTAISGFSELAINESRNGKNIASDLDQILDAANRGKKLTEQLLSFARKQITTPKIINPNEVLTDAMKFLPRMLSGKAVLVFNQNPESWHIKIDPVQLDQIIINLVMNARDAMADSFSDNEIILEINNFQYEQVQALMHASIPNQEYVCLSVTDTGMGIPLELQQKIFEPFFTTKGVGRGSGLGLSVCYGVVKQYGGYIFVDSEVGEGTTFHIIFPRAIVSDIKFPERQNVSDSLSESSIGGDETLLLVEDDPAVAMLTRKILESSGYNVLMAVNGLEALDVAEKYSGSIDLVITDMMMPKMDGKELVDTLKLLSPDMGIICISGFADTEIVGELRQKGVIFLAKPYTPLQLAKAVRGVLNTISSKNNHKVKVKVKVH